MKQYTGNQYDDDLTVGTEDYDDSYYTGSVDFFEFATDDESPISRLKSLILSIDWEITDEILMQFNEELIDLRDIWAGEKINLVYVQALEKISKYIYQKKANSHPSAIKLLLTLYHNLEKIVSSYDLTEEQKKEILLEDVKRFESLKRHIGQASQPGEVETPFTQQKQQQKTEHISSEQDLLSLKANVLGIDWEITDQDLNALRQEVVRLEEKYAGSRPKIILLQGIGTLAAYIKLKKSNAHADAFKLLHLFYESLEKIVVTPRSLAEEKAILFPAVKKFNSFKSLLGPTIATEAISRDETEMEDSDHAVDTITLAPAFADLPEEEVKGFQAEEEAQALGLDSSGNIDNHVENFFMGVSSKKLEADNSSGNLAATDKDMHDFALQGVNVEVDDEDETDDGQLFGGKSPTPALSDVYDEEESGDPAPALSGESPPAMDEIDIEESFAGLDDECIDPVVDSNIEVNDNQNSAHEFSKLDRDLVLQGVDVETEADDDSDEEALPLMAGKLAPALAENDEVSIYNASIFEKSSEENIEDEIAGTLSGFFDEEIEAHLSPVPSEENDNNQIAAQPDDSHYKERQDESPAGDLAAEDFEIPIADEQAEDIAALEERLDSFFDIEEDLVQPERDMLLHEDPVSTEDLLPADEQVALSVNEDIEEEVVFELVEEETDLAETGYAMYQHLQNCADALGIEYDAKIIDSLLQEINTLYQKLADKPLEKTFLQLLSAVTRHIDRNRADSTTDAYVLVQSVCTALTTLEEDNLQYNQEMLLTETHKVLNWQEQILQQLAAKKN